MFHIRSHALSKYFLGLFLLLMLAWFGWNDICRPLYEQIRLTITKKETCHVYTTWLAIWSRPNHYNSFFCLAIAFLSLCFRQKIERSTLTGSNREVVISTAFHSFGLTVYGQYIYWTDFYTKKSTVLTSTMGQTWLQWPLVCPPSLVASPQLSRPSSSSVAILVTSSMEDAAISVLQVRGGAGRWKQVFSDKDCHHNDKDTRRGRLQGYYLQEEKETEILDFRLFIKCTKGYILRALSCGFLICSTWTGFVKAV